MVVEIDQRVGGKEVAGVSASVLLRDILRIGRIEIRISCSRSKKLQVRRIHHISKGSRGSGVNTRDPVSYIGSRV